MLKTVLLFTLLLGFPLQAFASKVYLIEGEITDGISLFESEPYYTSTTEFPVDYIATLTLDPTQDEWSFAFDVFGDGETAAHEIVGRFTRKTFEWNKTIDFLGDGQNSQFVQFVQLVVDLGTGTGEWSWSQHCPWCELYLSPPNVRAATITSITEVPEPSAYSLLMVTILAMACILSRNRLASLYRRHKKPIGA